MRRLSENEKKHRDMPDYVSGEINGLGGSDKLKTSLYHFVKILKDKNDRKEAQRKLNKNINSIVDVLEDVYNIVENASYDQKLESPTEIPLGQPLSPESENVDYDVTTFTGSHAETLKKVLLRFYSKYLYIGPQIKHGDQVQQFEYNKRHILKDLDNFINMQLMKLDDDIQNENKKTMKKIIRLTESDLAGIVNRVINENKKKPSNEKIEDVLKKLMDDYIGEDEWTGGHKESSDKPYDRFMIRFKQSGDDTEDIAEEIIDKLNNKFESNLFKLGNASKNSFWFYIK
jgi:hypothetical protein